jgi:hypothetical protein
MPIMVAQRERRCILQSILLVLLILFLIFLVLLLRYAGGAVGHARGLEKDYN